MKPQNKILIVDDSELNRSLLADMLRDEYEVLEAENGLQAIKLLEFHQFEVSLILLDIIMPEMDGFEVLAMMNRNGWIERIPVIIISAETTAAYAVDGQILNKPGKLTHEEYEKVKAHSGIGANMLEKTRYYPNEEIVRIARDICRWHHERYDGKGYPDGLVGDEIPIEAQVVSLADVFDALIHKRVYKDAYSHQEAFGLIFSGQCGAFNPLLLQCMEEIGPMLEKELKLRSLGYVTKEEIKDITRNILQCGEASNRTLALLEQERIKYQFIADMSKDILFEYTCQTDILTLSEEGAVQLGLPEIIVNLKEDERFQQVMKAEDFQDLRNKLHHTSPGKPTVMENYCMYVNGQWRWFKIIARLLWLGNNTNAVTGAIGKCMDVHAEITELERLKKTAHIDDLTGLYRRNHACTKIKELLNKEQYANRKYALMLFDLDFFKHANDLYGHMFGDQVLREAALKVQKSVRKSDIVARIGGDEFLIFVEYNGDISTVADRIFQSIGGMYQDFHICASMGVALSPIHATEYELLFHYADQALYAAKHRGRNCYCIYEDSIDSFLSVLSEETPYKAGIR